MIHLRKIITVSLSLLLLCSCHPSDKRLPILGSPVVTPSGTMYPTITNFSLLNQNGSVITNNTFANKVYVADFIFLSCPTICPKMTREMYKACLSFADDERVGFISYTIDPAHDTLPRLKAYASTLGVTTKNWHFLTGNQDSIMALAQHSYFSTAYPDSTSPGGFVHSGGLLLVDKSRHIRGVYNGTKPEETERLINDIRILLKEQF